MKNYKATKEFIYEVRNCCYSGKELMQMMENRFKLYDMAGYPEKLIEMTKLQAKMGEDKYGNNLFACVLSEIPSHINKKWNGCNIISNSNKSWYESYCFLTKTFPEIEPGDYEKVQKLFEWFLYTMNEPLILAA